MEIEPVEEMGRWRVSLVLKREVRERVWDSEVEWRKSVVVLGLGRRECGEKVGREAIEEREVRERECWVWVWVWMNFKCAQHFHLPL